MKKLTEKEKYNYINSSEFFNSLTEKAKNYINNNDNFNVFYMNKIIELFKIFDKINKNENKDKIEVNAYSIDLIDLSILERLLNIKIVYFNCFYICCNNKKMYTYKILRNKGV